MNFTDTGVGWEAGLVQETRLKTLSSLLIPLQRKHVESRVSLTSPRDCSGLILRASWKEVGHDFRLPSAPITTTLSSMSLSLLLFSAGTLRAKTLIVFWCWKSQKSVCERVRETDRQRVMKDRRRETQRYFITKKKKKTDKTTSQRLVDTMNNRKNKFFSLSRSDEFRAGGNLAWHSALYHLTVKFTTNTQHWFNASTV